MAVNLSPVGGVAAQFFTNNAVPLSGGKLFTYAAGTTTPQVAYTTSQGNIAWTNPIVLDAGGRVPGSGEIWLTDGLIYKFVLKDSNDVLIATYDNITGINSNAVAYTNSQEIQTATAGQTVFTLTTMQYQVGTNSLSVFVDGVNQYGPGAQYAYVETDSTTVTFASGLHVGAEVKFTTTQQQGAGAVDAEQVSYTPPFANSVTTNVEAKLAQTVSVKDFGAVGDGVADDYQAFVDAYASLPDTGGTIIIPTTTENKWYLSNGLVLNKPVRFVGQLPTSSLYVVNTGTVLEFAADKTGFTVNSYNSQGANPGGTPAGNWCEIAQLAIVSRGGPTGLNNGGTGVACDGILIRGPGTRVTNVWAYSFRRNGVRIDASIGSGGVTEGNANLWYLNDVQCLQNGGDGLYVDGTDANAGLALKVNCSNNLGWGINDSSFLGNTYIGCHTDSNTLGPILTDDANAQSVFIGCYAETGEASLVSPTIMIGGLNSSTARVSAASTAFVLGGGAAVRKPYTYIDDRGVTTIGSTLGRNDSSMSAMTFGALTESASLDAWKLKFDITNNAWFWQFANSPTFEPIRYINSSATLYTDKGLTGPVFQNGYGVRNTGDAAGTAKARLLGTSAPVSGTYEIGDIVYNSAPASGGYIGWVCTAAGTPGTWKTFGLIS